MGPFQSIAIGVVLGVVGACLLGGGLPMRKMKDGQPSQWALRARIGAGLYIVAGIYLAARGALWLMGCVGR